MLLPRDHRRMHKFLNRKFCQRRKKAIAKFVEGYDELILKYEVFPSNDLVTFLRDKQFIKESRETAEVGDFSYAQVHDSKLSQEYLALKKAEIHTTCTMNALANWMDFSNPVENWYVGQQGIAPSCNGWAVADGMLTFLIAKRKAERRLSSTAENPTILTLSGNTRFAIDRTHLPSVRYIWALGKEQGNVVSFDIANDSRYSLLKDTIENLKYSQAIPSRRFLPYVITGPFTTTHELLSDLTAEDSDVMYHSDYEIKIRRFIIAEKVNDQTFEEANHNFNSIHSFVDFLKEWISIIGPLALEFEPAIDFKKLRGDHRKRNQYDRIPLAIPPEISRNPSHPRAIANYAHTVVLVGWKTEGKKTQFILRNQFGLKWGYYGQAYISQDYFTQKHLSFTIAGIDTHFE